MDLVQDFLHALPTRDQLFLRSPWNDIDGCERCNGGNQQQPTANNERERENFRCGAACNPLGSLPVCMYQAIYIRSNPMWSCLRRDHLGSLRYVCIRLYIFAQIRCGAACVLWRDQFIGSCLTSSRITFFPNERPEGDRNHDVFPK